MYHAMDHDSVSPKSQPLPQTFQIPTLWLPDPLIPTPANSRESSISTACMEDSWPPKWAPPSGPATTPPFSYEDLSNPTYRNTHSETQRYISPTPQTPQQQRQLLLTVLDSRPPVRPQDLVAVLAVNVRDRYPLVRSAMSIDSSDSSRSFETNR